MVSETPYSPLVIRPDELLEHWQGHRRLTRRVIQAFPEGELFRFSVGGMRPCAALALEMISMAGAGIRGLATRQWTPVDELAHHAKAPAPTTKAEILRLWDEVTDQIGALWPQILADVIGRPVHQLAEARQANTRGAAFLAFHRLGLVDLETIDRFSPIRRVYEPRSENRGIYDELFAQFVASYEQTLPLCEALNA